MTTAGRNSVEKLLVKAQAGEIDPSSFMQALMQSELYMPVHESDQIGGLQSANPPKPLTLTDAQTDTQVLILFTSAERAREFVKEYPGYDSGLYAEFQWVIENPGAGFGISINPGHDIGLDLPVDLLKQFSNDR